MLGQCGGAIHVECSSWVVIVVVEVGTDVSSAMLGFDSCHSAGHDVTLSECSIRSAAFVVGDLSSAALSSEWFVVSVSLAGVTGADAAIRGEIEDFPVVAV